MVSGVQHPHMMPLGILFSETLPIVRAPEQSVQDDQMRDISICGTAEVTRMWNHATGFRHARY